MRYHKSKFQSDEKGVSVIRREGEEIEALIRRFRKKVTKNGIYKDLKVREFYEKPSLKKRRKSTEAKKRLIKDQMKEMKRSSTKNRKDDDK